ncbi:ergothioneine biosynthesis protein EgtB [Echinicola soli]|uniref:Ergothioneine biosynthesis protein EgtB n=1 Tax=Echinicola soli TaxID=2591634 RepID=A0A514CJY5_9BACT|nr:ergothioneine biosynthesis protein EgtB [Echinicola soli]QDH80100.1 ergothioneine biosynthesis protein EgtB [Echinicola soli]
MTFKDYIQIRERSEHLCSHLETEDFVIQAAEEVSPAKWHLAHTSWFFETFVLKPYLPDYKEFHPDFSFFFNSYYNAVGARTVRNQRGLMTRPTTKEVFDYRAYIDQQMKMVIERDLTAGVEETILLGLNHEQQHQELLLTDLKYNLWLNPLLPAVVNIKEYPKQDERGWVKVKEAIYEIGHEGKGFCYDNECARHKVYLEDFEIASQLVSNKEYLDFVNAGGYEKPDYWHSDGWAWVQQEGVTTPLYWLLEDEAAYYYTLDGKKELDLDAPLAHVSFYEAAAYAEWAGCRLPTEAEWEVGSKKFSWGERWEWTNSAYLPYPRYQKAPGAIGEYNGKFMINQMVLRGASVATSPGHSRSTYRNFFHPQYQWQFTGIRLCKK